MKIPRKQREVLHREELILEMTRDIVLERGYHGLTMDRVADGIEYSKGTVYQHFPCKEEVLTELGIRVMQKRTELFDRGAGFAGRTRERMVAIGEGGEIFMRLYPDDMLLLQIVKTEVIAPKVSAKRQARMKALEYKTLDIMVGLVREAVSLGELRLRPNTPPQELPFALWAITDGGYATILRRMPLHEIGIDDPYRFILKSCDVLGDGYGWRPLSTEWDYDATRRRVRETLFAAEMEKLGAS